MSHRNQAYYENRIIEDSLEVNGVNAIAEHDHLFAVKIHPEKELPYDAALSIIYRSAIIHSYVGFNYKRGQYLEETSEVCLLQLCSVEGLMVYYVVKKNAVAIPRIMQEILGNENIRKVGIFHGDLIDSGPTIQINNRLDVRYAAQISGFAPLNLTDLIKSVLKYSVNMNLGTRANDKYFMATYYQQRNFFLQVFFGVYIFHYLRYYSENAYENNYENLCNIYKDKMFKFRKPIS